MSYDQISGLLVDAIWIVIKKSKKIYDETGNELYATQTQKTSSFKFQIIIRREEDFGAYKLDANTYHNKIVFSLTIDPDIEPDYYTELNVELQGTVRHELEHLLQEKGVPEKAKFPSKYMLNKINSDDYEYLIADHETEAMVKGFYRQAKTQKEKLDVVMSEFLSYYIKDDRITKKQAKEIKDKWLAYAKKHLPAALYKKINEDFVRGIDPKRAMRTGAAAKPIYIHRIVYERADKSSWHNDVIRTRVSDFVAHTILKDLEDGVIRDYIDCGKPDVFDYMGATNPIKERKYTLQELKGQYVEFKKALYKIAEDLHESQNFTRGLEPKTAMGIGLLRYLKPALLNHDSDGQEEIGDWLKKNPTLAKELEFDFNNPKEYENILGIEVDYYCEENDVESEDLEKEFQKVKTIKTGGINPTKSGNMSGEVNVTVGKLVDGSKVLFYYGGLISGYAARKEWLGINEAQNFTRGLEPKDAMETGDVVGRTFRKECKRTEEAIALIAKENGKENETYVEIPSASSTALTRMYGFNMSPKLEFNIHYSLFTTGGSRSELGPRISHNQYCASFSTPNNPNGEDGTTNSYCYDNLEGAVDTIKDWIEHNIGQEFEIVESQNFTRGLEPNDAMSIGNVRGRAEEKIRKQIIESITKIANEFGGYGVKDISTDGESIRYRFYKKYGPEEWVFYIMNELDNDFAEWGCGWYRNWSDKMDKPNFEEEPQTYFSSLAECEDEIVGQLKFRKTNGKFHESMNFERGLDPKDAMQTGDLYGRKEKKIRSIIDTAIKELAEENNVEEAKVFDSVTEVAKSIVVNGTMYVLNYDFERDDYVACEFSEDGNNAYDYIHFTNIRMCQRRIRNWIVEDEEKHDIQ